MLIVFAVFVYACFLLFVFFCSLSPYAFLPDTDKMESVGGGGLQSVVPVRCLRFICALFVFRFCSFYSFFYFLFLLCIPVLLATVISQVLDDIKSVGVDGVCLWRGADGVGFIR